MTKKPNDAPYWLAVILILAVAVYASNAKAETALLVGGWSHHVMADEDYRYNETHNAIMVERDGWLVGRFDNSYNRETWAIGYGRAWKRGNVKASLTGGLMRGYEKCYDEDGSGTSNICPMIYPSVTYTKHQVQPQLGLLGNAVVFLVRVRLY